MAYAFREVWNDIAGWFFFGILLAGLITTLVVVASFLATYALTWVLPRLFEPWNAQVMDMLFRWRSASSRAFSLS